MTPATFGPSIDAKLQELDATDRAIEHLVKRIGAQEKRIAHLKRDGCDCQSAEQIRTSTFDMLREHIKHRAEVVHAISCRQSISMSSHRSESR